MKKCLPRGLRNHNPLNIRKSSDKWQGLAAEQNDPAFCTFVSNEYGYRAAFITIRTYQTKYRCMSISDIISRWAPNNENNTKAYVKHVAEKAGISACINVYCTNKEDMVKIVSAMAEVENGLKAVKREVEEGYRLAFGF
nr:MAG TPA: virion protein [Caudoviricetes sp.]